MNDEQRAALVGEMMAAVEATPVHQANLIQDDLLRHILDFENSREGECNRPFWEDICDLVGWNSAVEDDGDGPYAAVDPDSVLKAIAMVRDDERARLWQRADDPEVVRELAGTIGGGGGGSMDAYSSDNIAAAYRAREILLTLLLGPRPSGQEAADER